MSCGMIGLQLETQKPGKKHPKGHSLARGAKTLECIQG